MCKGDVFLQTIQHIWRRKNRIMNEYLYEFKGNFSFKEILVFLAVRINVLSFGICSVDCTAAFQADVIYLIHFFIALSHSIALRQEILSLQYMSYS